ncbi:hypothetical protein [Telmatospirillum siberiense]|uniref:Uncharacterized protein n=1 Tax=Telmatospirillum siberiense TaxID=382514 RepID=A0A2N3Q1F8_9PROT|nr:hypothetical protein [Telmatospirillum siberiense]PKU26484.1 hypothetical protein CWS72_01160 [Telmatospirillum siberiense]
MGEPLPSIDRSLWRYYKDGGKGFAARKAQRMSSTPGAGHDAEKETVLRAAGRLKRGRMAGGGERSRGGAAADASTERARQALLGMILSDGAQGEDARLLVEAKAFREQIAAMEPESVTRLSAFFQAVRGRGEIQGEKPVLKSLESELTKRGISLELSGKVNNVYLSGEQSHWTVDAKAGGDDQRDGKTPDASSKASERSVGASQRNGLLENFGRFSKNFLLGH